MEKQYFEFVKIIEMEVLANIDKAFHSIVAIDCNQKETAKNCKECAEYLKNRLDGYIDSQAELIGQYDADKVPYIKEQEAKKTRFFLDGKEITYH